MGRPSAFFFDMLGNEHFQIHRNQSFCPLIHITDSPVTVIRNMAIKI